jgi:hypothetical protein
MKGHLFKLGQVNSPKCDRCNQVTETASYALCPLGFTHIAIQLPRWMDILCNGVKTSLLAGYCTLFKVWGCYMHECKDCRG